MGKFKEIWDPRKDGSESEKRSFLRYSMAATLIFVVMVGFVNENNLVRWFKAGMEIHRQEKHIETLSNEIEIMDDRIHGLSSSRDSLERYAREEFNFAEPGDDVFVIVDN